MARKKGVEGVEGVPRRERRNGRVKLKKKKKSQISSKIFPCSSLVPSPLQSPLSRGGRLARIAARHGSQAPLSVRRRAERPPGECMRENEAWGRGYPYSPSFRSLPLSSVLFRSVPPSPPGEHARESGVFVFVVQAMISAPMSSFIFIFFFWRDSICKSISSHLAWQQISCPPK